MRGFFSTDRRDASWRAIGGLGSETVRLSAIGYRLSASQHYRGTRDSTGGEQNRAQVFPLLFRLQNACTPADVKETLG
ncbi:hypothetical protein BRO09_03840 [Xanthomonas oryzae pv. oryzae]|nr:hypothetical protein BRO09_03840 [Xanthomonas oryzae pv. oryzae]RBB29262.1 hypothetical protein BRO04_03585 [Xanthomonas oryzae pv. oryzae]RBJ97571.1 hypothetical protein BRN98_06015 [Xanthomonas oryzae pv. oryzae]RBK20517.1 hypothetical protein BRN80_10330 [Xanthomonas oryzae pv. oryzae]